MVAKKSLLILLLLALQVRIAIAVFLLAESRLSFLLMTLGV